VFVNRFSNDTPVVILFYSGSLSDDKSDENGWNWKRFDTVTVECARHSYIVLIMHFSPPRVRCRFSLPIQSMARALNLTTRFYTVRVWAILSDFGSLCRDIYIFRERERENKQFDYAHDWNSSIHRQKPPTNSIWYQLPWTQYRQAVLNLFQPVEPPEKQNIFQRPPSLNTKIVYSQSAWLSSK